MGRLIGRIKEKQLLEQYVESEHSEFIAIYGRRRIGKTFLVTETLGNELDFDMTGVMNGDSAMQLTMITTYGLNTNVHSSEVAVSLDMNALFD